MTKITIAVDGFSSCGKSTLAKAIARELGYIYVDTGAMYRAVTLFFLRDNIDIESDEQVNDALDKINISFQIGNGRNRCVLNGEDVEEEIRGMEVSNFVSPVATISAVRKFLVKQQRQMGDASGVVMDGRDIGTVVFPYAELKIFVTADTEVRAKRRLDEMMEKGIPSNYQDIKKNLKQRDRIDSTREDSPLKQAFDARELDNTDLTREEQLEQALKWVESAVIRKENRLAEMMEKESLK